MSYGDYSSKRNIFSYYMDSEESSSPSKDLAETDPGHSGFQNDIFPIKSSPTSSPLNPNSFDYPSLNQATVDPSLSIQPSIPHQTNGEFRPLYDRSQLPAENNLDSRVSSLSVSVHISGGMTPPQPTQAHPSQPTRLPYSTHERLLPPVPLNPPQTLTSYSTPPFVWNIPQSNLHAATFQQHPSQAPMDPHTITINNSPSPQSQPVPLNNRPHPNSFSTQFTIHLPQFVQPQLYPSQETMSPHSITINNTLTPRSELTQRLDPHPQTDSLNPQTKTSSYSTQFTINFPPPMPPSAPQLSPLQQMMNLPPVSINPAFHLEQKKLAHPLPSPPVKASLVKTSYPKKKETKKFVMYNPEKNYPSKNVPPNASPRRVEKLRTPAESKLSESASKIDLIPLLKPCKICKTDTFNKKCRIKTSDLNKRPICNRCQDVASNIIAKLDNGNDIYKNVPQPKIELYSTVYKYLVKKNMVDKNNSD